ncbi:MAG: TraB/GumN family protein [Bacteroidota bacterium]
MNYISSYIFGLFAVLFYTGIVPLSAQVIPTSLPTDSAQQVIIVDETTVQTDTLENALLWEISGNGLEASSYLFGTIHLINKKDFIFTDATKAAFDQCSTVAFEIKLDDVMNLGTQFSLMTKVFMNDGKSLQDLLQEEDYELVKTYFNKMGLPLTFLERMKPMFLSALVSGDASEQKGEASKMVSYEFELMDRAQHLNKEIAGLETLEFQMGIFDKIPYDAQAKMLVESIKMSDAENDQFQEMIDLYKTQNLNGLERLISSEEEGLGEYEDVLLHQRNKNWISKMQDMMQNKRVFFAVGAGHLAGETGVINLLKAEGYTLQAIR